ncbi:MAG: hypothetical protein ER33_16080 [Cyanobium sp. CACIAM 14]|nr:MAG: hypothetical protein ER33_16080 [Cyanobium sp. CACIAM 14]
MNGITVLRWTLTFLLLILAWTGMAYGIHRLAHHSGRWNLLNRLHRAHHHPDYLNHQRSFRWHHFLLCFGSLEETLDVWITLTLPALLLSCLVPSHAPLMLGFHYLYEIFLSDDRLDHNPSLRGGVTRWFAWGQYHLEHHRQPTKHFGLILTFWDVIFMSGPASNAVTTTAAQGSCRFTPAAHHRR